MADASRCGDQQSGRPYASFKAAESRLGPPLLSGCFSWVCRSCSIFAGNTPNDRAWVRSIFERANANHVLHYILASDEACKARLRLRNETKPEGLYFGFVGEDRFDEVTRYFTPPSDQEHFHVIYYEADAASSKDWGGPE